MPRRWYTALSNDKHLTFLFCAQAVSNVGDWLNIVALFVVVGVRWHGTALDISFIVLCMSLPMVIIGPFTGLIADRMERKTIMITSNVFSGLLVLILTRVDDLWQVYTTVVLLAIVSSFFNPAESGKIKELTPHNRMNQVLSMQSVLNNGAKILGPSLSGVIVAGFGSEAAFYIDSATFFVAAALLFGTPQNTTHTDGIEPVARDSLEGTWGAQMRQGISHILSIRWLWVDTLLYVAIMFTLQLVDGQIITLLRQLPHVPVHVMGFTMGASGLGMIFATLITRQIQFPSATIVMAFGAIGVSLGFAEQAAIILFHIPHVAWLFPLGGIVAGGSFGFVMIPFTTFAQNATPTRLSGRVFGVIGSLTSASIVVGPLLGGLVATLIGIVDAQFLSAGLLALLGIAVILLRKRIDKEGTYVPKSDTGVQGTASQ